MSKIFQAYKMKVGESADVIEEVQRLGTVSLFPAPKGKQADDFSRLAHRILRLRLDSRGSVICFASTASGEGASDAAGEEGAGAPAQADDATWIHRFSPMAGVGQLANIRA